MLILASASPRRRELLSRITGDFRVCPTQADESLRADWDPDRNVRVLALRKAFAARETAESGDWILAADTVVTLDGAILGKPRDSDDARAMLATLSGRTHTVMTGWALFCPDRGLIVTGAEHTSVTFRTLDARDLAFYLASDEPYDKAGAYGIQGRGAVLVEGITGDYFTVMGLPVCRVAQKLKEYGFDPLSKGEDR